MLTSLFPRIIRRFASTSSVIKSSWTAEETSLLQKCYAANPTLPTITPHFPDRTLHSIESKLRRLGLYARPNRHDRADWKITRAPWTEADTTILRKSIEENAGINSIFLALPHRHPSLIRKKVGQLGLTYQHIAHEPRVRRKARPRWSKYEDEIILEHISGVSSLYHREHSWASDGSLSSSAVALAKRLHRSPCSVINRIRRLKMESLTGPGSHAEWKKRDLLKLEFWRMEGRRHKEIAGLLNRSEVSIEAQWRFIREERKRRQEKRAMRKAAREARRAAGEAVEDEIEEEKEDEQDEGEFTIEDGDEADEELLEMLRKWRDKKEARRKDETQQEVL